jgi:hypothetical protein
MSLTAVKRALGIKVDNEAHTPYYDAEAREQRLRVLQAERDGLRKDERQLQRSVEVNAHVMRCLCS